MDNITKILLRQDSTYNWEQANPILSKGEPAVEIYDGSKDLSLAIGDIVGLKVGDGEHAWKDLKYQTGDYDSLKNQVDTNTENITTNTDNIETLQGQVSSLETTVGDSTSGIIKDISDLQSNVFQNATNIDANARDIGLLQQAISDEETRAKSVEKDLNDELDAEEIARYNGDEALKSDINTINSKIPTGASSSNKLADTQYVDDSISNLSASYLSSNAEGDPFATHSQLVNASIFYCGGEEVTPQKNDYCTVLSDETMPVYIQEDQAIYTTFDSVDDYVNYYVDNNDAKILVDDDNKNNLGIVPGTTIPYTKENPSTNYTYQNNQWVFSKIINDNSFTTQQMSAINSGATSSKIEQIETNRQNIQTLNATKQAALSTDYSLQINNQNQISLTGSLPYITTAPSAPNLDGGLRLVVLEQEPATRYDGYWYLITGSSITTYTITNNLTNCTNSNNSQSIDSTESYSGTLSANVGYTLTGASVSVTMDGVDVTSTVYNNGTITIAEVTGDIVITATAASIVYDVYNNLVDCTSNNANTHATYGDAYSATITADNGYTLTGATVTVIMGGTDITSTAYNNGVITIASVTGNVNISVVAVSDGPQVLPASYFNYNQIQGGALITGFSSEGQTAYNNDEITDLILPSEDSQGNTIISINGDAFYNRSKLTSITIPNTVTSIGYSAFQNCIGLTSITIPRSVTSIDEGVFSGCSGLISITVDPNNTAYDSRNNCNCIIVTATNTLITGCKNSIIPNTVTSIGDYAFSGSSNLTSITIPSLVTSIGNDAFYGCSGLTSITIPNSVTTINDGAFQNCSALTSVTLGNGVISIGYDAFSGCSSLISITIPDSVTTINDGAFIQCIDLDTISIGNGVTSIGYSAFQDCENLTSITITATTPPDLGSGMASGGGGGTGAGVFDYTNDCPIYVPAASLTAYQTAINWSAYASRIQAIPA